MTGRELRGAGPDCRSSCVRGDVKASVTHLIRSGERCYRSDLKTKKGNLSSSSSSALCFGFVWLVGFFKNPV